MTIQEAMQLKASQYVIEQHGMEKEADASAEAAQQQLDKTRWLGLQQTQAFLIALEGATIELDAQAKDLARLDESIGSSKIRALLIESATINKVLDYARNITRTPSY